MLKICLGNVAQSKFRWAVCPHPSGIGEPKGFVSRPQAEAWQNQVIVHAAGHAKQKQNAVPEDGTEWPPRSVPEIRQRDQDRHLLVPVHWRQTENGALFEGKLLSAFLPLQRVEDEHLADLDAEIDETLSGQPVEIRCDLGPDWEFEALAALSEGAAWIIFTSRAVAARRAWSVSRPYFSSPHPVE